MEILNHVVRSAKKYSKSMIARKIADICSFALTIKNFRFVYLRDRCLFLSLISRARCDRTVQALEAPSRKSCISFLVVPEMSCHVKEDRLFPATTWNLGLDKVTFLWGRKGHISEWWADCDPSVLTWYSSVCQLITPLLSLSSSCLTQLDPRDITYVVLMNNYIYNKNNILPTEYLLIRFLSAFWCLDIIYPSPIFIFIINIPQEW